MMTTLFILDMAYGNENGKNRSTTFHAYKNHDYWKIYKEGELPNYISFRVCKKLNYWYVKTPT